MPTNLTGNTIASTFNQLLHVDGGPTATEKTVYSGTGVATALKIGTNSVSVENIQLDGNTIRALDTNGGINLSPNGTGEVNITNIDVISGKVPFSTITNRAYGQFYSTQDQTAAANTATAVTFNNSDAMNTGITVASNSRITFAAAGDYDVYFSIQLLNAGTANRKVTFWLRLNGTDIPNSATWIVVPASGAGGTGFFTFNTVVRVTAGQYVEVYWATESADVSLNYEAAQTTPFVRPAISSAILTANRIG